MCERKYNPPCHDYRDIHEAIEETTAMLLTMAKEKPIDWFCKSSYLHPIHFDMEIGNMVYSISSILDKQEYWQVFENTHPAIIDRETCELVQELRKHRRRPTKSGILSMFSGLFYCADCGEKLYYSVTQQLHTGASLFLLFGISQELGCMLCPLYS